jgi:hypothetical protein
MAAGAAALVGLTGCSGGGGGNGSASPIVISSQPLSGKIGGQSWSLGTAESDSFLSTSEAWFVNMYSETFTACATDSAAPSSNRLIANVPTTLGSHDLSLGLNATFYVAADDQNLVAIRGRIQIDSISATTVTGGLNVAYDDANSLDGQFLASICP